MSDCPHGRVDPRRRSAKFLVTTGLLAVICLVGDPVITAPASARPDGRQVEAAPETTTPPTTAPVETTVPSTEPPPTVAPPVTRPPGPTTSTPGGTPLTSTTTTGPPPDLDQLVDDLSDGVPEHYATQATFDPTTRSILAGPLYAARRRVRDGEARVASLETLVAETALRATEMERTSRDLTLERTALIDSADLARLEFNEIAARSFVRGSDGSVEALLGALDANEAERRRELLRSVVDEDEHQMVEAERRVVEATGALQRLVEARLDSRRRHRKALLQLRRALGDVEAARFEVAAYETGSHIMVNGFTFPVAEPTSFHDGWGDPRMTGTIWSHWHEGTDIMAPVGTALLAAENGIVSKLTTNTLGGLSLWLEGASGTQYYYAHLSGYEDGIVAGEEVLAGEMLAFVGDSGNARGNPHLHFEIHVEGGPVNPYPILRVAWEWRMRQEIAAGESPRPVDTGPMTASYAGPLPRD